MTKMLVRTIQVFARIYILMANKTYVYILAVNL